MTDADNAWAFVIKTTQEIDGAKWLGFTVQTILIEILMKSKH